MKAELPAPVRMIRRSGLASSGVRKPAISGACCRSRSWVRRQLSGCCAISRAVHSAPALVQGGLVQL